MNNCDYLLVSSLSIIRQTIKHLIKIFCVYYVNISHQWQYHLKDM